MKKFKDSEEWVSKAVSDANESWLIREVKWVLRHPVQSVQLLFNIGIAVGVVVGGLYLYKIFKPDQKIIVPLENTDYVKSKPIRESKFRKLFPDKKIPIPYPKKKLDQVFEIGVNGKHYYLATLKDSDEYIHHKDMDIRGTNCQAKWGLCVEPKLIGIVHGAGGDTGLGVKFFRVKDFGVNVIATSKGGGVGVSYKPFRRFPNTSLELGGMKSFDGESSIYGGIGVEF